MGIFENVAILLITGTVTSSRMQKDPDVPANDPLEDATVPLFSVTDAGDGCILLVSTKKVIADVAAFLEVGRYPMFRANETTFSLNVALSIKTSFATILALYEVIYVLYANTSRIVDKLEPSKS